MAIATNLKSIFPGNSEMSQRMRAFDWSKNELGFPKNWPEALKTSVRIILTSRHPMFIWWGENFINLHNDGYASFLHAKHPEALGKPASIIWSEIWHSILVPRVEIAKNHDRGTFDEAMPFVNTRRGYPEITYATFSYSPILNKDGKFGGVICPVSEETERIISQRQMTLLRQLTTKTLNARSRKEVYTLVAEVLQTNADDIPFALFYERNIATDVATLEVAIGISPETPAAPKTLSLKRNSVWPLNEVLAKNAPVVVTELSALSKHLPMVQVQYSINQAVILPCVKRGEGYMGALIIGVSPLRPWDDNYQGFLHLVSAGISSAIRNADACEAEYPAQTCAELNHKREKSGMEEPHIGTDNYLVKQFGAHKLLDGSSANLELVRLCRESKEALLTSEEKYRALFEAMGQNYAEYEVIRNENGKFVDYRLIDANSQFERLKGLSLAETLGRTALEVVPNLQQSWIETYDQIIRRGKPERFEHISISLDRWYEVQVYPRGCDRFAVLYQDITERKRREANQAILAEISDELVGLDNIADMMRRLGKKIGQHFHVKQCIFSEIVNRGNAMTVDGWAAEGTCCLTGTYRLHDFLTEEHAARINAGRVSIVNDAEAEPLMNNKMYSAFGVRSFIIVPLVRGNKWCFQFGIFDDKPRNWLEDEVGLMREITARLWAWLEHARAEEALRESEVRFRALVLANSVILYQMSADWTEMVSLKGKNYSMADTEKPRRDWLEVYIPLEEQARVMETINAAIDNKSVFELEHRIIQTDGTEGWVFSCAVPLLNSKGQIIEWFGAATDITERKQIEQALKEADRRKDEFLAVLAHELRNPIFPIKNAIYLLQQAEGNSPKNHQLIQIMERQVNHMVRLVDDLLEVSRIATGKIELHKDTVNLIEVINNAIEVSRPLLDSNQHQLILSIPPGPFMINVDMVRMTQVFANLLNNAAKYTPKNGIITVNASRENTHVAISVQDNGIGISAEILPNVFEIFTQGKQTVDANNRGLGIGLAMVCSLVELHHGTVKAYSLGHNRGSEFIVYLPLEEENKHKTIIAREVIAEKSTLKNVRVLIVDDNADITSSFSMLLSSWEIDVLAVSDGESALSVLDEFNPQVILLDIGMPGMDGYAVAEKIRQNPKYASIKLVAVTGWSQEKDRAKSRASGFNEHLAKPVDVDILRKLLNELIDERSNYLKFRNYGEL